MCRRPDKSAVYLRDLENFIFSFEYVISMHARYIIAGVQANMIVSLSVKL